MKCRKPYVFSLHLQPPSGTQVPVQTLRVFKTLRVVKEPTPSMASPPPLLLGVYYHIYNRGTNRQNVFVEPRNYAHFLRLYARYVEPVAETYAYCLLRNHFHLLIRTRTPDEQAEAFRCQLSGARASTALPPFEPLEPSRQLGTLFNAYAKAINKAYGRTGSLFQHLFGRLLVTSDLYCSRLITYIHRNAEKHGFVTDFRNWPYSSYHALLASRPTHIPRHKVIALFGGAAALAAAHRATGECQTLPDLIGEDLD
jgi:putative transposase